MDLNALNLQAQSLNDNLVAKRVESVRDGAH